MASTIPIGLTEERRNRTSMETQRRDSWWKHPISVLKVSVVVSVTLLWLATMVVFALAWSPTSEQMDTVPTPGDSTTFRPPGVQGALLAHSN
jgi:hypothetical protein